MTEDCLLLLGVTDLTAPPTFSTVPHMRLPCATWCALALPVRFDPSESEEARMTRWAMSQGEVLCRQVRASDVLPVKLGAVFSSATALRTHVDARHAELRQVAETCRGCVELAIQAVADADPAGDGSLLPASSGRAFLDRRRSARDRRSRTTSDRRQLVRELGGALGSLSRNLKTKDVQGRAALADWSILLSRGRIDQLLVSLEAWENKARNCGVRLKITGPWPPFAFIGGTQMERCHEWQ